MTGTSGVDLKSLFLQNEALNFVYGYGNYYSLDDGNLLVLRNRVTPLVASVSYVNLNRNFVLILLTLKRKKKFKK